MVKIHSCAGSLEVSLDVPKGMQVRNWRNGRFYEQKMLEHIYRNYQGGTFIDAGSALGNHTLFFAKFCKCKVLSVEPVLPSLRKQLELIKLNDLEWDVLMVNAAVSDYNGFGRMVKFGEGVGLWKLEDGNEVEVKTIDSLVEQFDLTDIKVLKLDVEWSELKALKGATNLLKKQHPVIFAELNESVYVSSVTDYLRGFGYKRTAKFPAQNYEFK